MILLGYLVRQSYFALKLGPSGMHEAHLCLEKCSFANVRNFGTLLVLFQNSNGHY